MQSWDRVAALREFLNQLNRDEQIKWMAIQRQNNPRLNELLSFLLEDLQEDDGMTKD